MVEETKLFSRPLAAGISGVSFLIAVMIVVQLFAGIITINYYTPVIIIAFVSNIVLIPLLLFLASIYKIVKVPALVWLHISMALMIIYFSQTYSPFTAVWSILILVSSTYYGWWGFISSSSALAITGVMYIVLFPQNISSLANYSFLSVLVVSLTIFTSYLFVRIIRNGQSKNHALLNAQRSELLQVNRLNTLLNSISDAVLTLNRYGRVTSQNAAAQAFFDTNESLIGREVDKILMPIDSDNKPIVIRELIDSVKSSSLRDDLSVMNGEDRRHLSLQISRIRSTYGDTEEYGVVVIIRDITRQKTLEEEKDEFISVTSHELRTPVAIAEGSLSNFMLMQERGLPQDKLTEAAETAHKQIIYLSQMINDLSTLSRAERGVGDSVESIDINEMLHNLYAKYTPQAEDKKLQLNLDAEHNLPNIETSKLYLEEIMQNFITNSLKYTKEGSVTFGAKKSSDGYVEFHVKDTGIGMNKTDLKHIFEKFYRSEDYRTRETNGTGLGLYVVQKLASKLGTKIKVESRLNIGSTFSFVMAENSNKPKKTNSKTSDSTEALQKHVVEVEEPTPEAVSS